MTTSIRFRLSYDPLQWYFVTFRMNIISIRKYIADQVIFNDVNCAPICYYTYGHVFITVDSRYLEIEGTL